MSIKKVMKGYNRVLCGGKEINETDIYYNLPNEVGKKIKRILELENEPEVVFLPKASVNTVTGGLTTPKGRHAMFYVDGNGKLRKISSKYFGSSFFSKRGITQGFDVIEKDSRIYVKPRV